MTGPPTEYDQETVQKWINNIEDLLEDNHEVEEKYSVEELQLYEDIERHYDQATEIITSEGLTNEACYEIELARTLLNQLGFEIQLENEPLGDQDWDEFYRDQL